jgi:hypothetical protein
MMLMLLCNREPNSSQQNKKLDTNTPLNCVVVAKTPNQNVDRATNGRERKGSEKGMEEPARK